MFGLFKRKPKGPPPPSEWQCGPVRRVEILEALEQATDSTVSFYRNGELQWSRDVARPLHEFTCRPLALVLNHAPPMQLPVYERGPEKAAKSNLLVQALSMAQAQAGPTPTRLRQVHFQLPDSFANALACKRSWLAGNAGAEDIRVATENVQADVQLYWPSNFCFQINAMQYAIWCVLSALNIESPWLSAHGCAQTAAAFMGHVAACQAVSCSSTAPDTTELVWECAQIGDLKFGRGIGCPKVNSDKARDQAIASMDQASTDCWRNLNQDLESALLEFAK